MPAKKKEKVALYDEVQLRLQHPEVQQRVSDFLTRTYKYGYACGVRGVPLRWHQGMKLRGARFIMKDYPAIKEAKEMLLEEGKQLASVVFNKAYSRITKVDVMHLYTYIAFICYETETVNNRGAVPMQAVERRVTTMNTGLAQIFIQDRLNRGVFDETKAKRTMKAVLDVQEEVLQERELSNYLYPRVSFKSKSITKHREAINARETVSAYAPVLMMQGYAQGLRKAMGEDVLNIYYTKINQELRVHKVCLDEKKIEEVYGGNPYVTESFREALVYDPTNVETGLTVPIQAGKPSEFAVPVDFGVWTGLLKLPELGTSPLDPTPLRSVSLLRMTKIRKMPYDAEKLKKFTYVDLSAVLDTFTQMYQDIQVANPDLATDITNIFIAKLKLDPNTTHTTLLTQLEYQDALGSNFRKALHLLMEGMPEVFPGYTGTRAATVDLGASDLPAADIVDLDQDLF